MKVLFLGESWTVGLTYMKGMDAVMDSKYVEYGESFMEALKREGLEVDYMPSHVVQLKFPFEREALRPYATVILSDIGSNNFLLHPDTTAKCTCLPNRLAVLRDYIASGGGLLTCGGYMSYSGIDGKARYAMTPLAEAIAVDMLHYDDRMECPEGVVPRILRADHPVLRGIDSAWPYFLGYNKVAAKPNAELIATMNGDAFMAAMSYGNGRSFAFASDCVPHWAPPVFVNWEHYGRLFHSIIRWLAKEI